MEVNPTNEQSQDPKQEEKQPGTDSKGRPTMEMRVKDGRKGMLFSVEMLYTDPRAHGELKRKEFKNLYWDEVVDIRHDCFKIGVMFGTSPNQWVLISPHRIEHVDVKRQNNFMEY
jgi:hypothetical protein